MTFGGMVTLAYFGRKTIIVWGSFAMAVVLIGLGVCFQMEYGMMQVVFVLAYLTFFQWSNGSTTWVYLSEIT